VQASGVVPTVEMQVVVNARASLRHAADTVDEHPPRGLVGDMVPVVFPQLQLMMGLQLQLQLNGPLLLICVWLLT